MFYDCEKVKERIEKTNKFIAELQFFIENHSSYQSYSKMKEYKKIDQETAEILLRALVTKKCYGNYPRVKPGYSEKANLNVTFKVNRE